uniref:Pol_3 protein n=1 Tax=Fopius arisanus TaxID=64838 RepID=A0A0C9RDU3_9HYME
MANRGNITLNGQVTAADYDPEFENAEHLFRNVPASDRSIVLAKHPTKPIHWFRDLEPNMSFTIPPKVRLAVPVEITNPSIEEGYLPKLNLGNGIFAGEAAIRVQENIGIVMVVNPSNETVKVRIPPQELQSFDFHLEDASSEEEEPCEAGPANIVKNDQYNTPLKRIQKLKEMVPTDKLNELERAQVERILESYHDIFFLPGDPLGCAKDFTCKIRTSDEKPINRKQYRPPLEHTEEIKTQVRKMLSQGIIGPSESPYNSPLWIVPKKADSKGNKRWRLVIDFRELNKKTIGDSYPLPDISEILDKLGGAKYFSVFDLANGFHQITMDPEDREKTAFTSPDGHFEYLKMPFGLKNAPAVFQRMMNHILYGLTGTELYVYLDDIVVYAQDLNQHYERINRLFKRLKRQGVTLQPDKCRFLCKEVGYLGHLITENGVIPDPVKIQSLKNMPRPRNAKGVRSFLGFANHYRRFIDQFRWGEQEDFAFQELKTAICEDAILAYPDSSKPFIIATDASDKGLGAVLSQMDDNNEEHPIAYASRTLLDAETRYSEPERDCLAVFWATKHFKPYVYGRKFILYTNSSAMAWLRDTITPTSRQVKWRSLLHEYEFTVVHRKLKREQYADAFSENPVKQSDPEDEFSPSESDSEPESFNVLPITKSPTKPILKPESELPRKVNPRLRALNLDESTMASRIRLRRGSEGSGKERINYREARTYRPRLDSAPTGITTENPAKPSSVEAEPGKKKRGRPPSKLATTKLEITDKKPTDQTPKEKETEVDTIIDIIEADDPQNDPLLLLWTPTLLMHASSQRIKMSKLNILLHAKV